MTRRALTVWAITLALAPMFAAAVAPPRKPDTGESRQVADKRCPLGQAWSAAEQRCVPYRPRS